MLVGDVCWAQLRRDSLLTGAEVGEAAFVQVKLQAARWHHPILEPSKAKVE
jgi:hypothetical protein